MMYISNFSNIRNMAPYERIINSDGTYASVRGWKDPKYLEFLNNNHIQLYMLQTIDALSYKKNIWVTLVVNI